MSSGMGLRAVVVGASALSLAASGSAYATAYAFADNQFYNAKILVDAGNIMVDSGTRSQTTTAQYTGFPSATNTDSASFTEPGGADAPQATSGPGPFPAQNNFSNGAGLLLGMVGTRADALFGTGNPFTAAGLTSAQYVAEGVAVGGASGSSDGRTAVTGTLTATAGTILRTSFTDNITLRASTTTAGESATATVAFAFTLRDSLGNIVFSFAPTGSSLDGVLDPFDVNSTLSSDAGSLATPVDRTGDFLSFASSPLAAGVYTFSYQPSATESVVSAVPEPASFALLGTCLLGLGLLVRHRTAR